MFGLAGGYRFQLRYVGNSAAAAAFEQGPHWRMMRTIKHIRPVL